MVRRHMWGGVAIDPTNGASHFGNGGHLDAIVVAPSSDEVVRPDPLELTAVCSCNIAVSM